MEVKFDGNHCPYADQSKLKSPDEWFASGGLRSIGISPAQPSPAERLMLDLSARVSDLTQQVAALRAEVEGLRAAMPLARWLATTAAGNTILSPWE